MRQAGLIGNLLSGSIHIAATASIYPPNTVTCDANGNMVATVPPTSIQTVLDQTLYDAELFTLDSNGLAFPLTDQVDSTDPQSMTITMAGPSQPTPTYQGDSRISQSAGDAGNITLRYTPDPNNTSVPQGQISLTAPDGSSEGNAPVNQDLLNFDPLAIRLSVGQIESDGKVTKIENAKLEIGLRGGTFQSLTTFEGDFYADNSEIKLDGTLTVDMYGQTVTLFDGEIDIPRGQSGGDADGGDDSVANAKIAGLEFDLTKITFVPGMLQLEGSVKLPTKWGNLTFSVDDPNYLQIKSDGSVSITGADIDFPDAKFSLFGVDVESTALHIHYVAETTGEPGQPGTPASLKISGEVKLSADIKGVQLTIDANLQASDDPSKDSYILISSNNNINTPYTIDVKGVFSFTDNFTIPPLPAKGFGIPSGSLAVNTVAQKYTGMITVKLPGTSITLDGTLGLLKGAVNEVGLTANNINEGPLGEVPVWIQTAGLHANNIADPSQPLTFTGTLGVTIGPAISPAIEIPFPNWTGLSSLSISSLVSINGTATVDANHFEGTDNVVFLTPGLLSGMESINADWQKGSILLSGSLSGLGGLFTLNGNIMGSVSGGLTGTETASLNLGQLAKVPGLSLLSHLNLGSISATAMIYIAPGFNSGSLAQDYVQVTGSAGSLGTIGLKVFFNGTIDTIGHIPIPFFGDPTFTVPSGTSTAFVAAEWTDPLQSGGVTLALTDPNGNQTTVNTTNPPTSGPILYVPSLSSSTSALVTIANPVAGTWSIAIADTTGLGTVSYDGIAQPTLPAPPTLSLTSPNSDTDVAPGSMLDVSYTASVPTAGTTVELFLDANSSGYDGTPIASTTAVDGGSTIDVNTSTFDLATGDYHIYALIDDGQNVPVFSAYDPAVISITDPAALPAVQDVQAYWYGSDEEELTWDPVSGADHYLVTLADTTAGGTAQTVDALGPGPSIVLSDDNLGTPLVPGDVYSFQVQAISVDSNGNYNVGTAGGQMTGIVGPTPTVGPVSYLAGEKFVDPGHTGVLQPGDAGLSGVTIELVDASDGTIMQSTTTDGQGQYFFGPLTPGLYTVQEVVDPTRPSDFPRQPGSDTVLLQAGATKTVNFGHPAQGSITGVVEQDTSYEGTADTPLPGVTVFLDTNGNGALDPGEPTSVTDANGQYTFTDLLAGSYSVGVVPPSGLAPAPDQSVTLTADQYATGVNLVVTPQLTGGPPAAIVLTTSGQPDRQTQHDLGTVLADGPGQAQGLLDLDLANFGGQPLTVTSLTFTGATGDFSVVGLSAGTTVQPAGVTDGASTLPFSIVFDPSQPGPFAATLTIATNDSNSPVTIALVGTGASVQQRISVQVPNNNAGGVNVSLGSQTVSNFGTVTNTGDQPLTITNIIQDPQFSVTGMPAGFGPSNPLVLSPGASQSFSLVCNLQDAGLQRGGIQFLSNDPVTPDFELHVDATGMPAGGPAASVDMDYIAIALPNVPGDFTLRGRTDAFGDFNFFLPPDQAYEVTEFDPISGLVAHGAGTTAASGQNTIVSQPTFRASTANDTNGDGLPDDIKFAVGTSLTKSDTNGDGIDDFSSIQEGLNPLANVSFPTGVIASLPLQGEAQSVAVTGSSSSQGGQTAYVATGSYGMAIVDASQFQKLILQGQIDLPGNATDVAVDPNLQIAAVATNSGGLQLVDVSDPTQPLVSVTVHVNASQVEVVDGVAYTSVGGVIQSYDLLTGDLIQNLRLSANPVTGMAREGGMLYVMESDDTLQVVDISGPQMVVRGSVAVPGAGGKVFLGNGIAYLAGATNDFGGYATVDVTNPDNPTLLAGPEQSNRIGGTAVAANGSGVVLAAGTVRTPQLTEAPVLDVMDGTDPTNTNSFLTRINLEAAPTDVAIASGIAFVADGTSLEVVNYLPFDNKGQAPSVSISTTLQDVDPATPGIQIVEGSSVPIRAEGSDDVQVRNVELLVNGQVVQNAVSYPWDLSAIALNPPSRSGESLTIQVRATDTGGNTSLSDPLIVDLLPDTTPPSIANINTADGSIHGPGLRVVKLDFSEPMATSIASESIFRLRANGGSLIDPVQFDLVNDDKELRILFPPLASGSYQLQIDASQVTDRAGNSLGSSAIDFNFSIIPPTQGLLFDTPTYETGTGPNSIAIGDLDGDGVPDIVTANSAADLISSGPDTVTVLIRTSSGTIKSRTDYTIGKGPDAVSLGDVNRDGRLDIVTANYTDNSITVLLGNGDGSFGNRVDFPAGKGAYALTLGDLNSDGKLDVVTSNLVDHSLSILLGNGDGTFAGHEDLPGTTAGDSAVFLGDVNGDGKLDIVTESASGFTISVLLGNGDGTFRSPIDVPLPTGVSLLYGTLGDVNGDGKLDIVAPSSQNGISNVSVLLGRGDGTFSIASQYPVSGSSFALGDMNGDGKPDIVFDVGFRTALGVLLGKGDGTFSSPTEFSSQETEVSALALYDMNGDGNLDVITSLSYANEVSVISGNGDGTLRGPSLFPVANDTLDSALGDVNGDGILDSVSEDYSVNGPSPAVSILLGTGDGGFGNPTHLSLGGSIVDSVTLGDVNGDGKLDIVGEGPGSLSVFIGKGDGSFGPPTDYSTVSDDSAVSLSLGDINGDGKLDIVLGGTTTLTMLNNGDGTFGKPIKLPQSLLYSALGDVNQDGKLDIISSRLILLGNGDGTFGNPIAIPDGDAHAGALAVGDVNGDGKLDIVTVPTGVNISGGASISIFLGHGDGTFDSPVQVPAGDSVSDLALSDLNGDGRLDIITLGSSTISVFLGKGDGTFGEQVDYNAGQVNGPITLGDVDKDGDDDVVVVDYSGLLVMKNRTRT